MLEALEWRLVRVAVVLNRVQIALDDGDDDRRQDDHAEDQQRPSRHPVVEEADDRQLPEAQLRGGGELVGLDAGRGEDATLLIDGRFGQRDCPEIGAGPKGKRRDLGHQYRILGSATAYITSAIRLKKTVPAATSMTTPRMTG